jgi:hypothetical protein
MEAKFIILEQLKTQIIDEVIKIKSKENFEINYIRTLITSLFEKYIEYGILIFVEESESDTLSFKIKDMILIDILKEYHISYDEAVCNNDRLQLVIPLFKYKISLKSKLVDSFVMNSLKGQLRQIESIVIEKGED